MGSRKQPGIVFNSGFYHHPIVAVGTPGRAQRTVAFAHNMRAPELVYPFARTPIHHPVTGRADGGPIPIKPALGLFAAPLIQCNDSLGMVVISDQGVYFAMVIALSLIH